MELKKVIQLVGLDLMLVVQRVPWKVAMMVVLMVSSMADLKAVTKGHLLQVHLLVAQKVVKLADELAVA